MSIKLDLAGLLFLVFLVLKLTNFIDWSWWWVTAPLWCGLVIAVIAGCLAGVVAISIALARLRKPKHKSRF